MDELIKNYRYDSANVSINIYNITFLFQWTTSKEDEDVDVDV